MHTTGSNIDIVDVIMLEFLLKETKKLVDLFWFDLFG